jgi:inositol transport system permease protein
MSTNQSSLVTNQDIELKKRASFKETAFEIMNKFGMLIILLVLFILMSILTPYFLTAGNLLNIILQMSTVGIIALGVTFVIITTGIDLSSGSVIALVSVASATFAHPGQFLLIVPILVGLLVGFGTGLINGTIVAKGKIHAFIVTLGMMTVARGAALLFTGGQPIGGISDSFSFIGGGALIGIPVPILIFALVGIVSYILLNRTKFGKYVYAIGGNEQAARIAGVNVSKTLIMVYSYAGLLTGIAGIILTARISSGQPSAGLNYELDAISAAVIGGTSLYGGIGTVGGTIIGALILGIINNGFDLLGVSSYWQEILKGVIIVIAVLIDSKKNKRS